MKTAISIPDEIFHEAEQVAKRRGLSRSELYTNAVKQYVQKEERFLGVRERLDAVYGNNSKLSELDEVVRQAQERILTNETW